MTISERVFPDGPPEVGCYIDSHHGHYAIPDMVRLAVHYGYILDQFERWALVTYDGHCHEEEFPGEAVIELADEALAWLNGGPNEGPDRPVKGQNSPPVIQDGYAWEWNDGDFGLYEIDEEE